MPTKQEPSGSELHKINKGQDPEDIQGSSVASGSIHQVEDSEIPVLNIGKTVSGLQTFVMTDLFLAHDPVNEVLDNLLALFKEMGHPCSKGPPNQYPW